MTSFLIVLFSFMGFSQTDWKLSKNEADISVFTRNIEGSKFKEFKATMTINASLDKIIRVLVDGTNLKKWNYKVSYSKTLERNKNVYYIYMLNDFAWPVKNRDHVSKLTVSNLSSGAVKINIESTQKKYPEQEGIIRVTNF